MTTTGTPATLPEWITVLRAELTAAGVTATSPDRLDADAERLAREERWG
jgi:hypothetical protein